MARTIAAVILALGSLIVAQSASGSPTQADPAIAVAVFGDSFSSGEGLRDIDPGEPQCQRALGRAGQSTAWGVQVARTWGAEPKWFAACTGAVSANFADAPQADAGRDKTQLLEATTGSGLGNFDALVASFGGNDIRFATKIRDCLGLESIPAAAGTAAGVLAGGWLVAAPAGAVSVAGGFARCSDDTDAVMRQRIEEARGNFLELYKDMASAVRPGGTIIIAGYPQILATIGEWPRVNKALHRCQGIHLDDADKLNGVNARLNEVTANAVTEAREADRGAHRWQFVDVTLSTFGPRHALCGSEAPFVNGLTVVPRKERSFHPNQDGHDAYAQAVLRAMPSVERRPPPVTATAAPAVELGLGAPWAPDQEGFGAVKPSRVYYGGVSSGSVEDVTWRSWGGDQAIGDGTGYYVPPDGIQADARATKAVIHAFKRGTCKGKPAYTAVNWHFPSKGESFDSTSYTNACTGDYVDAPAGIDTSSWEAVGRAYMKAWSKGDTKTMQRLGVLPTFLPNKIPAGTITCKPPTSDGRATCQQPVDGAIAFVALTKAGGRWTVTEASGAG